MRGSDQTGEEVFATLTPRPARRWGAVAMFVALAVLLLLLAMEMTRGSGGWALFVAAIGALAGLSAIRVHAATHDRIELTSIRLRDTAGRELARIDEIQGIDRGAFAFKPSNGFLLRLKTSRGRAWAPGLWWRIGPYVGVGGITPRNEAKAMAETIALLIADRED